VQLTQQEKMQNLGSTIDDVPASQKKWLCEYCTYENWPSNSKCTMCRGKKPARLLGSQNIYSAVPVSQPHIYRLNDEPSYPASPSLPDTDHTGKWACQACTYYNYPKSIRCTQCLTTRRKVSPTVSRNSPGSPRNSPLTLPSVGTNPLGSITTANRANAIRSLADQNIIRLADQLSPLHISVTSTTTHHQQYSNQPSPETSKEFSSPRNKAGEVKWNCLLCTYENYPRSLSCVLCGARRGRTSPDQTQLAGVEHRNSPSPEGASMKRSNECYGAQSDDNNKIICEESPAAYRTASQSPVNQASSSREGAVGSLEEGSNGSNNLDYEKRLKQLRRRMKETDWSWLSACMGVVEGDSNPVEAYLNSGGDPTRKLTQSEATLLGRPGVYDLGHTLVHLAIKLSREDMLATLLSQMESASTPVVKRVPSYVASDLAASIRRNIALSVRQRKGPVPCFYLSDSATYTLPPEMSDLPRPTQDQLLNELLDREAQAELETEMVINWSAEVTSGLGSRLSVLWNRSAGDCLLDAALQATWGVFDRDNTLRRAISDSLVEAGHVFYPRWKEWEMRQAQELDFTLAESQWAEEWAGLLSLASQPGESLEQLHVFCLAHVLRRPICIYGVKYVKSWRGENLGYAKFEGVYLPLLWDSSFCYRSPIALGYTRGHFSALVPPEPDASCGGAGGGVELPPDSQNAAKCTFLPLMTKDRSLLPVHFLTKVESGRDEEIMRDWMDVLVTESGLLVAQQNIVRPPLMVAQMTEEWLNYYRKIAQTNTMPLPRRQQRGGTNNRISNRESSEESDE
jgi:ubiquitin thioesterase ZRANB1